MKNIKKVICLFKLSLLSIIGASNLSIYGTKYSNLSRIAIVNLTKKNKARENEILSNQILNLENLRQIYPDIKTNNEDTTNSTKSNLTKSSKVKIGKSKARRKINFDLEAEASQENNSHLKEAIEDNSKLFKCNYLGCNKYFSKKTSLSAHKLMHLTKDLNSQE